jgi:hypothetical protein
MLLVTRRQRVMGASLAPATSSAARTFGDTVKRSVIASTAVALLLALGAATSAFAADPSDNPVTISETPNPSGEISVDPTFITPEPAATPASEVLGTKGRPERTPPPTDAVSVPAQAPGTGLQVLLLLGAAGSSLVLLVGRLPVARRR